MLIDVVLIEIILIPELIDVVLIEIILIPELKCASTFSRLFSIGHVKEAVHRKSR